MSMQQYSCQQVKIDHEQLIQLRQAGHLNLGMDNSLAIQISNNPDIGPTKSSASIAFHFWNWVAIGVFGYSIYLSVTGDWWWFIPGAVVMSVILKSNKKGNSENLLDAAFDDPDFYERVREVDGWIYQIEESEAVKFSLFS